MTATLAKLCNLAHGRLDGMTAADAESVDIAAIELNAADVPAGGMFAALPGTRTHGARYAEQSDAVAILTDAEGLEIIRATDKQRPVVVVDDVRAVLGHVAAEIYEHPSESLTVIGVTGTSGKTTTTYMLEGALLAAGCSTGIIGTTGTRINGRKVPSSLTTPEAPALQRLFREMLTEGVTHVVMEVSSHALSLGRVAGVRFDVGCFLNLSQDHLDFHNTLEEYFQAKATLFDPKRPLHAPQAVVCIDDDWGVRMADIAAGDPEVRVTTVHTQHRVTDASPKAKMHADWSADTATVTPNGMQHVTLTRNQDAPVELDVPLPGAFNVANAAVAWAVLDVIGHANCDAKAGLAKVRVPGRMERIDRGQDFLAVVDYAHKPAAVAEVLATLRAQTKGRVLVVVGAGGDRDATKRPIMGAEAARGADVVIITDDNPRSEVPAEIRAAVVAGAKEAIAKGEAAAETLVEEVGDRGQAIRRVVELAESGDSIVVAGKGHETGQDVGGVIHPFDDREQLAEALSARLEGNA
ncbi:MAG: UDP-N-acetylmuramoyl-L-alanyl-D-glutamate--2,6-diaminopimelate ligase [Corynebacterium sp.]|uniref:UDP-N-acetylmuramoyl-L-alanyl-D-glutamate--2, 6-diaminopimelate ligase n=1 Tax=Corynebacterium sp. TaxID=1720 RepID=UPI0026DD9CB6|nr:UDP-N-acetylmuramoyl-L-alanyl-D-glutamate--2,6-diaminopimelate ligase [Corynebacterium sp.]MDO5029646.1 UDP-N-acetylmuramoyl-L-alanyl-D-glutamate--2,6-diaminopimelate ligase [Corynebacterium sp.]